MKQGKTAHIDIRMDPELLGRIHDWMDQLRVPPSRSAVIVHMIEVFLDRHDEEEARRKG